MRNRARGVWSSLLMTGGIAVAMAAPAAAGDIFSWRTEDGGYAFADDIDAVPERYRAQVEQRRTSSIRDYRRYTAEDEGASSRYQDQLAARLERLRERNAPAPEKAAGTTAASGAAPDYLTVRTGGRNGGSGVDISTPTTGEEAPLETDTVYMRRKDGMLTQPVRVTRRGDRIVSVSKPRNRNYALDDAVDEVELDAQLPQ